MMAQSKKIALAALKMAMTESREEEANLKESYLRLGVKTAALQILRKLKIDFREERYQRSARIALSQGLGLMRLFFRQSSLRNI